MSRPKKCRKVCCLPKSREFMPSGRLNGNMAENLFDIKNTAEEEQSTVIMTVDEYETIRLIDKEGFSQEECSTYMHVARTTIQQIYTSARHKIATAIVDSLPLRIEGGDYELCDGEEEFCDCGGCLKHRCRRKQQVSVVIAYNYQINIKIIKNKTVYIK